MKAYIQNKITSLGLVITLIIGSFLWFGNTTSQWQFLLLCLIGFGYGHFIVGFVYQIKSFFRKPNPWLQVTTFLILALSSVIIVELLFSVIGYAPALFIGFAYFLLHGLFNEQTLILRQVKMRIPLLYIFSLAIFVFTLLAYTVPDPTFLFNRALQFADVSQFVLLQAFLNMGITLEIFPYIFWGGVGLSFMVLFYAWLLTRWTKVAAFLAASYVVLTVVTVVIGAIPYIYMYLLVVGYHFMTWFLFYFIEIRKRKKPELFHFFLLHILVLAPFIFGGWIFLSEYESAVVKVLFDYKYFVIATYAHISVSFMNDEWFQNLQSKLYQLIG